jgi:hypothetical protein
LSLFSDGMHLYNKIPKTVKKLLGLINVALRIEPRDSLNCIISLRIKK